jgi:predicted nucleic acid-binding protein
VHEVTILRDPGLSLANATSFPRRCAKTSDGAYQAGHESLHSGYDVLIAGHARSRDLVLVAGQLHEFNRVDGLQCEDWFADPA